MTVAPVVVRPDAASNTASVKLRCGAANMNGVAVTTLAITQMATVTTKPSRRRRSYSTSRTGHHSRRPISPEGSMLSRNAGTVGSFSANAITSAGSAIRDDSATMAPTIRCMARRRRFKANRPQPGTAR